MRGIILLATPLKSIFIQVLNLLRKISKPLIALFLVGLGVLVGQYLYSSPYETVELVISYLVVVILFIIIADKPLNGLLLLLLLMPFVEQYIEIPMGAGIPDLSFSRFIVAFLFVFMLAHAAIGKFQFAVPISLTEVFIIAATAGIMSSASLSDDPIKAMLLTVNRRFLPLIMYFLARSLVKSKKDLNQLLTAIAIFGFAAGAYAIYEFSTGNVLFVGKETEVAQLRTSFGANDSLYLLRGLLGRGSNFGRVFISTIPITFYLFFENKEVRQKIFLVVTLIIQGYAMFLTLNRTSWYSLMLALFILQLFYPQFRKLYIVMAIVAALTLWVTWDQVSQSDVVEDRVNQKTDDFNGRSERWKVGWKMWQLKPVFGWGVEGYDQHSGRFRTDGSRNNFNAIENDYLFLLVSSGLLGFVPYMVFWLIPLVISIPLFFRARAPDWAGFVKPETVVVYWCVIISLGITSYTQVQNQAIVLMFPAAVAGAIVGSHQYLHRKPKQVQQSTSQLLVSPSVGA